MFFEVMSQLKGVVRILIDNNPAQKTIVASRERNISIRKKLCICKYENIRTGHAHPKRQNIKMYYFFIQEDVFRMLRGTGA